MKPRIFWSTIIVSCWLPASAETNNALTLSFALPAAQLRSVRDKEEAKKAEEVSQPERTLQFLNTSGRTNLLEFAATEFEPVAEKTFSVSVRGSDLEMEVCKRLEEGGYLTRPEPETPLEHFLDRTFSPEVIRLGRNGKASCTLYTAIVRKNPLCLLNPMFLFISW